MKDILIMGIESSCDETSVSIVKNGREVLSNCINSQIKIHEEFGGVVPEVASRNHVTAIDNVELPLVYRGMKKDERNRLSLEALERVGLGRLYRVPSQRASARGF